MLVHSGAGQIAGGDPFLRYLRLFLGAGESASKAVLGVAVDHQMLQPERLASRPEKNHTTSTMPLLSASGGQCLTW